MGQRSQRSAGAARRGASAKDSAAKALAHSSSFAEATADQPSAMRDPPPVAAGDDDYDRLLRCARNDRKKAPIREDRGLQLSLSGHECTCALTLRPLPP